MKDVFKKLFGSKVTEKSEHHFCFHDNCTGVVENNEVILAVPDPIPTDLKSEMFDCYNIDKIGNNQDVSVGYIKPTLEQMYSSVSQFIQRVSSKNEEINRDSQIDNLDNNNDSNS